eukprot:2548243-Amphidinium_carterae.1
MRLRHTAQCQAGLGTALAQPPVSSERHLRWADGVDAPAAGMRCFYPSGFSLSLDVPQAIAQFGHTADQIR